MYFYVTLVNGETLEENIESNVCIIGRSSKCTLVIPHEGMSRQHCQIELIGGDYYVTDLGSTNGVIIDGEKIEPHRKVLYQTYLTLSFGAVQSLQIKEEPSENFVANSQGPEGVGANSITRTKMMKTSPSQEHVTGPRRIYGKQIQDNKFRNWTINILAILMVAGAALWYLQKDEEASGEYGSEAIVPETELKTYDQF